MRGECSFGTFSVKKKFKGDFILEEEKPLSFKHDNVEVLGKTFG
jgi:hypothetical protein